MIEDSENIPVFGHGLLVTKTTAHKVTGGKMQALLIAGDGVEVASVPFTGNLDDVSELFGCTVIERVRTPIPNLLMLVDEDGRIKNRPRNHKAMMFYPGAIFGPALLTYCKTVHTEDGPDIQFTGIPDGFDFGCVAESSYQRIVSSIGEHPEVTLEGQ